MYNIQSNKWAKFNQINKKRSGFATINLGEVLYFIGGNDGDSILSTVETLNIATG